MGEQNLLELLVSEKEVFTTAPSFRNLALLPTRFLIRFLSINDHPTISAPTPVLSLHHAERFE
jgi:hypothetical protein